MVCLLGLSLLSDPKGWIVAGGILYVVYELLTSDKSISIDLTKEKTIDKTAKRKKVV